MRVQVTDYIGKDGEVDLDGLERAMIMQARHIHEEAVARRGDRVLRAKLVVIWACINVLVYMITGAAYYFGGNEPARVSALYACLSLRPTWLIIQALVNVLILVATSIK